MLFVVYLASYLISGLSTQALTESGCLSENDDKENIDDKKYITIIVNGDENVLYLDTDASNLMQQPVTEEKENKLANFLPKFTLKFPFSEITIKRRKKGKHDKE